MMLAMDSRGQHAVAVQSESGSALLCWLEIGSRAGGVVAVAILNHRTRKAFICDRPPGLKEVAFRVCLRETRKAY